MHKLPVHLLVGVFFGGKVEGNETPDEAIIREVHEELNLDISVYDIQLLAERSWISPHSGEEKMVYFYESTHPISWTDILIQEGAGAAFVSKEEIARMDGVSLLAKTLIAEYVCNGEKSV